MAHQLNSSSARWSLVSNPAKVAPRGVMPGNGPTAGSQQTNQKLVFGSIASDSILHYLRGKSQVVNDAEYCRRVSNSA